ncbi:hypothetical protein [Aporhodopirellula aestuarii]|uniref:Glycosyltransferase RgtA/B/C/D-like domain-containing protein n=1 Tax=Aporhodopirellula aestuarii TaxID=2950107 RepID=A0ABT0UDW4_9BACT|nr:hypothetical protein [Aporhodopirellula aestuarii]MCM2375244.1 hypothetical protein [Aporhodopirellula aestuarii]
MASTSSDNQLWRANHAGGFLIATVLLSILCWGAYFWNGYFRYDDFEVVSICGDGSFWDQLFVVHGDHTLPLFRIEMWVLLQSFGTEPFVYNLFYFLIFVAVPVVTFFLFREFRIGDGASYLFLVLFVTWLGWPHLVAGYYILSVYLQAVLFTSAAVLFLQKYLAMHRKRDAILSLVMASLALAIELAGVIVIPILVVFLIAGFRREFGVKQFVRLNCGYLTAFVLLVVGVCSYLWYVFRVLYPGRFLVMAGASGESEGFIGLVSRSYLVLRNGIVHTLSGLNLLDLSDDSRLGDVVLLGLIVMVALACRVAWLSGRQSVVKFLLAASVCMLGAIVMTAIGRPQGAVFKHVVIVFYWFSVVVAVGLAVSISAIKDRSIRLGLFVLPIVLCFLPPLLMHFQYPSSQLTAARYNLIDARARRLQLGELANLLLGPLADVPGERRIPTLDGNYLFAKFGSGLYKYDMSFYRHHIGLSNDRVVLYRNQAMSSWTAPSVQTADDLRDVVDSRFKKQLKASPSLRELYLQPIVLGDRNSGIANLGEYLAEPIFHTATELPVTLDEQNHDSAIFAGAITTSGGLLLSLNAKVLNRQEGELQIYFTNDFAANGPLGRILIGLEEAEGVFQMDASGIVDIEVALDQIYAFSLSESISECRIQVEGSQVIQIDSVELRRR